MPRHAILMSAVVIAAVACTGDRTDDQTDDAQVASSTAPPSSNSIAATPETLAPQPSDRPIGSTTTFEPPSPPSTVLTTAATIPTTPDARNVVSFGTIAFELPPGWERSGPVVATEFAIGADCVAGTIVDFQPPIDQGGEGEAAFRQQSSVQVCSSPTDGRTLAEFMDATYADRSEFEPTTIGGLDGYRSGDERDSISFAQSGSHRYQIVISVAAAPDLEERRLAEASAVVRSLSLG